MDTSDIIYIGKDYLSKITVISVPCVPVEGGFEPQKISGVGEVLRLDLEAIRNDCRFFSE